MPRASPLMTIAPLAATTFAELQLEYVPNVGAELRLTSYPQKKSKGSGRRYTFRWVAVSQSGVITATPAARALCVQR